MSLAGRIYKQRRSRPYFANGRTVFNIQGKPGVYLIYIGDKIAYIGYSGSNIYKTLYRHFQSWNDKSQVRVTYNEKDRDITVRVVYTATGHQAAKLERALILKHKPTDNPNKYEQYILTPLDKNNISEFSHMPIKNIVRTEEDWPF